MRRHVHAGLLGELAAALGRELRNVVLVVAHDLVDDPLVPRHGQRVVPELCLGDAGDSEVQRCPRAAVHGAVAADSVGPAPGREGSLLGGQLGLGGLLVGGVGGDPVPDGVGELAAPLMCRAGVQVHRRGEEVARVRRKVVAQHREARLGGLAVAEVLQVGHREAKDGLVDDELLGVARDDLAVGRAGLRAVAGLLVLRRVGQAGQGHQRQRARRRVPELLGHLPVEPRGLLHVGARAAVLPHVPQAEPGLRPLGAGGIGLQDLLERLPRRGVIDLVQVVPAGREEPGEGVGGRCRWGGPGGAGGRGRRAVVRSDRRGRQGQEARRHAPFSRRDGGGPAASGSPHERPRQRFPGPDGRFPRPRPAEAPRGKSQPT